MAWLGLHLSKAQDKIAVTLDRELAFSVFNYPTFCRMLDSLRRTRLWNVASVSSTKAVNGGDGRFAILHSVPLAQIVYQSSWSQSQVSSRVNRTGGHHRLWWTDCGSLSRHGHAANSGTRRSRTRKQGISEIGRTIPSSAGHVECPCTSA